MGSPTNLNEVERLVSLACFQPCLAQKEKPLFRLLKGSQSYNWNEECETMFQQLKKEVVTLPIFSSPQPNSQPQ